MAISTAIFVGQELLSTYTGFERLLDDYLALSVVGLLRGYVWQLLTFQFLHASLFHLICNLIGLYFFGRAMEECLGRARFLQLYLISGVVGGLLQVGFAATSYSFGAGSAVLGTPVVGASAGVFGLVTAFATLFPDRVLTLLVFFVIPVSMRARTLLWISLGLAVFGLLTREPGVAHAAHLGGIAAGFLFIRTLVQGRGFRLRWSPRRPFVRRPRRVLVRAASGRQAAWQRPESRQAEELSPEQFITQEVDPILEKISAHGFQSLTDRERQILENARARISRR
jgi:membrane associated rhomboid family serine protease